MPKRAKPASKARSRSRACPIRVFQELEAQLVRLLALAIANRVVAVDELREIQLKFVLVARRVRALHLAELALEARVHDALGVERRQLPNVAIVLVVDGAKQDGKRVAVLEAHATAVADLEDALDFFVERVFVPVFLLGRVVAQPVSRQIRDLLFRFVAHARGRLGLRDVVEK